MQRLWGRIRAALGAVAANFKARNHNVETAIALDLAFQPVEEIALELQDFSAPQAGHMNVVPLRAALVEMLFALHVHQVKFIDQAVPLEQFERTVNRDSIDASIEFLRVPQNLRGVEVLIRSFDHAQDGPALVRQPHTARCQRCLQSSWSLGLG